MVDCYQDICNISFTSVGLSPMDGTLLTQAICSFTFTSVGLSPPIFVVYFYVVHSLSEALTMDVSSTFTFM